MGTQAKTITKVNSKRRRPQALRVTVSLRTLSEMLDAGRSSVRRWLKAAGIQPIAMSDGPKGALRYRWADIEAWLESRETVE